MSSFFQQKKKKKKKKKKKNQLICILLNVNLNKSLTNDVVSVEQLGPDFSPCRHCYGVVPCAFHIAVASRYMLKTSPECHKVGSVCLSLSSYLKMLLVTIFEAERTKLFAFSSHSSHSLRKRYLEALTASHFKILDFFPSTSVRVQLPQT